MLHELYQSKENRDLRVKELKSKGMKVYKSVSNNQELHPAYVKDFGIDDRTKTIQADNGFGNCHYKTYFPKLYAVNEEM